MLPSIPQVSSFSHVPKQTSRIWDALSGETKAELRGHEMSVESITFVPVPSYKALGELVDLGVSCIYSKVLVVV
jgi:hypothetical protein